MNQELLNKYAAFTVQVGVNVQKGQTLIIRCPVEGAYFGRACMEAAYKAGARDVVIRWEDEKAARIRMELGEEEALSETKPYELRSYLDYAESEGGWGVFLTVFDTTSVVYIVVYFLLIVGFSYPV